jgi:putative hydrolase of the HAD superfamily
MTNIRHVFLDIGGVLLTNGWDHHARQRAAKEFKLDYQEMNERHHLTFDTLEEGKITLEEYFSRVIFFQERSFTRQEFREYMFSFSQPYPEMLDLIRNLKEKYHLRVGAISNESRELTEYRIQKFKLNEILDFFISSCFVHFRKPDQDIYRMALDVAQVRPENAVYIEDRPMFVQIAQEMGLHGIIHKDYDSTCKTLADLGLKLS